jgi:hypothetical protein
MFDLEARFVEPILLGPRFISYTLSPDRKTTGSRPQYSLSTEYIYDTTLGEIQISLHYYMLHETLKLPNSQNWS